MPLVLRRASQGSAQRAAGNAALAAEAHLMALAAAAGVPVPRVHAVLTRRWAWVTAT